ncbi:TAXI family TRAP transporter solute-binding subunit [Neisseria leonii]|uniref:TAXI family TRAP transporter solute-binding subunit n=1 Tax=Neisseria leonii TaxID=2995413 RepID=A0A9X4IAR2_9NEIS|nr:MULTISPECIES: TAXI family TRAP transporter solute-binding subunit [unclassified Neisseria]MDD9324800.1 TAXI family TRAP transporter solute-binding subunit [Neisseria sp. 3986]MDD9327639.1 TAXI family TRAP transporter solute-binding subunit [Neisseria sp. 51.81]
MLKKYSKFAALMTAAAILAACGGSADKPAAESKPAAGQAAAADKLAARFVTIATGGASGPYNIIGTSLAEAYAKVYGVNAKTQSTGASVENLNLLDQGKAEMAFVMSDALNDAVKGTGSFQKPLDSVAQIAALYPNYVQIVASAKSGIRSIEDLRGKRVAVGAQNSGVELASRALLNGFGITYNDLKVDFLGYAEAADALKSGKLDAAFLTSGLPNSSLMELQQGFDLQLVSVPADKLGEIAKTSPFFNPMPIPAGTYNNAEDVPTAAILNALVVRADLSEDDVYKLTKTFFESLDTLKTAHQAAGSISLEAAQKGLVAPLHPGAKRYYDEAAK